MKKIVDMAIYRGWEQFFGVKFLDRVHVCMKFSWMLAPWTKIENREEILWGSVKKHLFSSLKLHERFVPVEANTHVHL